MGICYIFGALPVADFNHEIHENDFVIAADKGLENVDRLGIIPNLIVGDFDSLGYAPSRDNVITLPVRKDDTDIGFAIKEGLDRGYLNFCIYGAIGGLLDHTFANLQLSAFVAKRGGKAVYCGDGVYAIAINNSSITLNGEKGRVSVFANGSPAKGVYLKNLSYELTDAELTPDFPLGVSNELIGKKAEISVNDGSLLIISEAEIGF